MGISDSASPENALARAFELYRRLSHYMFKYELKSPEEVLGFLERAAADGNRRGAKAEKLLQEIMNDPTLIFYETAGHDLTAPNYYEDLKKEGYEGDFLDFLSDIVSRHLEEHNIELKDRHDLHPLPQRAPRKHARPMR